MGSTRVLLVSSLTWECTFVPPLVLDNLGNEELITLEGVRWNSSIYTGHHITTRKVGQTILH